MKIRRIQESYVLTEGKNIDQTWEQYKDKLSPALGDNKQEWINYILSIDPTYQEGSTNTGDFGIWLTNKWLQGQFRYSDSDRIKKLLSEFIKKKPNLQKKDINQYRTIDELSDAVANTQLPRKQERKQLDGAKPVYEDDDWIIYIPETYEASCALGGGSGWCTADTRSRSMYDYYLNRNGGEYYVLISKFKPTKKYQFHFESDQFAGAGTNPGHTPNVQYGINYDDFIKKYPKVGEFFNSINKEPIPPTPLTLQDFIDYITEHCQVINERVYASIGMDELYSIFNCGDALMLSSMGDFASYYYSDSTLTKLFADSNNAYTNKMKQLVQRIVSEPDIDATVDQVLQNEKFILWALDEYLSDADESDLIIQEILNNANKPYIEYEEYKYVRISCDLNYIANLLYDFADERDLLVDIDIGILIEQALYYYVYYSDSTNDTSILRSVSLDTEQSLVIGAIAEIHDSEEQSQEDMVSFMITDLNKFRILPNILNHALYSDIFYSNLLDVVYTYCGKDTNESMIKENNNKMNINEEFTDKAKQATPAHTIRISVPQWFWSKAQEQADKYRRTLCWDTKKVYMDDENWKSDDTFYLYGVPKQETEKSILFELNYFNLARAGRYITDAPIEGGWKAYIPKSVIRNLDDIIIIDPGNNTTTTSSVAGQSSQQSTINTQGQQTSNNSDTWDGKTAPQHQVLLTKWYGDKISKEAKDEGYNLFTWNTKSGLSHYGEAERETAKAVLIKFYARSVSDRHHCIWKIWVPKSQITNLDDVIIP